MVCGSVVTDCFVVPAVSARSVGVVRVKLVHFGRDEVAEMVDSGRNSASNLQLRVTPRPLLTDCV